jgi:hypothetical protein
VCWFKRRIASEFVLTLDVIMPSVAVGVGVVEVEPVKRQPPIVPFDTQLKD